MSNESAFIVLNKHGRVVEGQFAADEAHRTARDIGGVVVAVPILADYRGRERKEG